MSNKCSQCSGIILADTEDWRDVFCEQCYRGLTWDNLSYYYSTEVSDKNKQLTQANQEIKQLRDRLIEAEDAIKVNPKNIKVDVFRVGDAVNANCSGVRVTHIPTGISVIEKEFKGLHNNQAAALRKLQEAIRDKYFTKHPNRIETSDEK